MVGDETCGLLSLSLTLPTIPISLPDCRYCLLIRSYTLGYAHNRAYGCTFLQRCISQSTQRVRLNTITCELGGGGESSDKCRHLDQGGRSSSTGRGVCPYGWSGLHA